MYIHSNPFFLFFYCVFPSSKAIGYSFCLLVSSFFEDKENIDAGAHVEFLQFDLSIFEKTWDKVVCLISDSCNTNKLIATKVNLAMVGCDCHRLNLAV